MIDTGGVRFKAVAVTAAAVPTRCGCSWPAAHWRTWRPSSEMVAEAAVHGVEAVDATAVAGATEAAREGAVKSSTSATRVDAGGADAIADKVGAAEEADAT